MEINTIKTNHFAHWVMGNFPIETQTILAHWVMGNFQIETLGNGKQSLYKKLNV